MRFGLYQKFFLWSIANVVLLALLCLLTGMALLFCTTDHLYPPQLFNGDIREIFRTTVAELQYKNMAEREKSLQTASTEYGLRFLLQRLDVDNITRHALPPSLLEAALRIPRPPYSLCATPEDLESAESSITPRVELEAGIIPQQYAIFMRADDGENAEYWYARTILLSAEDGTVCYALLAAAAPSVTGNGHFFILSWVFWALAACLMISFLWWYPFVHALMRPIVSLTRTTRELAAGNFTALSGSSKDVLRQAGGNRTDELGTLLRATAVMAEKVYQQVHGQRRFLRQIAHELNSPLARLKLGLAVLENRVEGDAQKRTQQLAEETEQLSILVEDLLGYLRSEAIPNTPVRERIALCTMLEDITRQEKNTADVRIAQTAECHVLADPVCLRRALGNVIRNAVRYAGTEGPITINLREGSTMLDITVEDCGPGVTVEDLPHITEPFYRGKRARRYPGGSGLGLSIVKHCAEACGGTFTCENILPRGFRVTLRLPIDVKTPAPEISIVKKRASLQ